MAVAIALFATAAPGEEAVETIVVTGQRIREPELRAPTTFVTVIDPSIHSEQLETVTDALAEAVGVQVRRFGGLGAFSTVSIRGSASNQVQFYLDGIPLSRARNETVNVADLPLDSLQRIEVFRGTAPVSFSSVGPGGVVNLVSKAPTAEPHTEVSASFGSFSTRKVVASHTQRVAGVDVLGHVTYLGSKGDFSFVDENLPEDPEDDAEVSRRNNDFDSVFALLKALYSPSSAVYLDLTSELFLKDEGVPGIGNTQSLEASFREFRSFNYLRGTHVGLLAGDLEVAASLFGIYQREQFSDPERDFGAGRQDRDDATTVFGGNTTGTYFPVAGHDVGWSAELSHERFAGSNEARTVDPDDPEQTRLRLAVGLQDTIALWSDRLQLVPTLRYEHLEDDVSDTFGPAGQPQGRNRIGRDLWSPAIGAQLSLQEWLHVKGNLGLFQRAPNFSELFGNRGNVAGRTDLREEEAINRDVGFVVTPSGLPWFEDLRLEYAYFNNDIDDIIVLLPTGSPATFRPGNLGAARIRGHEAAVHGVLGGHLRVDVNYTHQDAENRSIKQEQRGRQLPGRPRNELYTRLELFSELGKVYYEFNLVDENFLDPANFRPVSTRDTHTFGSVARVTAWLALSFEARNVTDNQIEDALGFPLPGRAFFGTVKATF
jgi:iron complex outermembrane receptor protein